MADVSELGRKVKAKYPKVYDDLDDADLGRRVKAKHPGAYDDFTDTPKPPATVLPQDRQTFGRRPMSLDESLAQSAQANRGRSETSRVDTSTMTINPESVRQAKRKSFENKPITERTGERVYDALARGGGQLSRMARQTVGAGLGVARGINSGDFSPVDLPAWRGFEEERNRELEERRQLRPSSFLTDTLEGIIEGSGPAAAGIGLGMLTGGSLPAMVATGAGMGAAGADWSDPRRALVQTGIGAAAPILGGVAGSRLGGAVASRLTQPVAQTAARVGGELVGGSAGNVIGSGAEQLAFEGRLNPRELARSGIVGAALNVPGAGMAARRPARSNIPAAQPVTVVQPEVGSVAPPPIRQTAEMARPAPRQTAEIPRVEAPPTRPLYPDAPETQEMPEIRARIAAEEATTKELPAIPTGPTGRITGENVPPRPRTERLPVEKATDENIKALRDRREQLSRLEATRRGEFPSDLRDEFNQLGAAIRDYEDARAPRESEPVGAIGGRERGMSAEEKAARREVLSGRKIQHSTLGLVTESSNQKGVPKGKMRVDSEDGSQHLIQNPRTRGNREASFVRSIPDEAMPELQMKGAPPSPLKGKVEQPGAQIDYSIPAEAMPELRRRPGQVMGMGLGALQPIFDRGSKPKPPELGQQGLFETAPKRSLAKRAASNVVSAATLPRALMASADLSAPLRQGAILTLPPTQWGRAAKSGVRMVQALKTSKYEGLVKELNDNPDAKVGKESGLYMATDPKKGSSLQGREEDFISKWAEKIPIVKHSEQAYKTYLDSIRLETFKKYKKVIDGDKKLSFEQKHEAYKAAADWINVASGRGSLGKTLDKAMPALSTVFFAPRYTASRIQVLNPATYAKNLSSPAGRVVLRQQMSDLVQFAGMVSATLALAKAAGAEVGTDPEDGDFLKIKIGNVRYDTLAGLQQVMRLFYRIGKDVGKAAVGQKSEQGEGALEIAGKFARSKLAPVPSFFTDALSRKDFIGRDFEVGRGVGERVVPLMWKDFVDAYQREGFTGAAKLSPGIFGLGVQDFAKKPGVLTQKNEAYMGELKRLGVRPSESAQRLKDEPEDLYKGRAGKIESWRDEYGGQLIQHPMYQRLSDQQKKAAVESLHGRISQQANEKRPNLRAFNPAGIVRGVREGERNRRRTDRDKIYVAPR